LGGDLMSQVQNFWNTFSVRPFGKTIFSKIICWKAPYFGSIKPAFEEMRPGYSRVSMKKRRAVHNHIQTIHAIAMCNLAELGAGTMMEASLSSNMRWLPRGMSVQYLKKAETDIVAECVADAESIADGPARDVIVKCDIKDSAGNVVCHADITMYVSPKKAKNAA
jgi:acyl-coenzyme A thioesterase PaaI-like protein